MKPAVFLEQIVDPALLWLAPIASIPVTPPGRLLTLVIAGQEGDSWTARRQYGCFTPGEFQQIGARGYWQFERLGGVAQLLWRFDVAAVCAALDVPHDIDDVYEALAWNDTLACSLARILLWQDPARLPVVGDEEGGWQYYLRNWRPGAPDRARWHLIYPQAIAALAIGI